MCCRAVLVCTTGGMLGVCPYGAGRDVREAAGEDLNDLSAIELELPDLHGIESFSLFILVA